MNEEGLTTIIHRDRHGTVKNTRELSVPLTSELGDSETLAMSQKGVTDSINNINATIAELEQSIESGGADVSADIENLQNQINQIISDKATRNLSTSPSTIFVGEPTNITVSVSCTRATAITIRKGSTALATGDGTSLSYTDPDVSSAVTYYADITIAGISGTVNKSVSAVHPIYVGAGATADAAVKYPTPKTSPAGTYSVNVETSGSYVWFLVPNNMSISSAKKNGFDYPLEAPTTTTKDGVIYKVYRSSYTYDEGTETIVIS